MTESITVRTALACDDIRVEDGGKLIAIGVVNPIINIGEDSSFSSRSALRLYFLLSLDVPHEGEHQLVFRLRGIESPKGQTVKLGVVFSVGAKQIPLPIGPLTLPLVLGEQGFKLQQQIGDRWKTIAMWNFEKKIDG